MKCFFFSLVAVSLFFAACGGNDEARKVEVTENVTAIQNEFLNLFKENNSDTLQIQSTTPEYLSEMPDYKFLGQQIDKIF